MNKSNLIAIEFDNKKIQLREKRRRPRTKILNSKSIIKTGEERMNSSEFNACRVKINSKFPIPLF